jgi:VRR-NUC domain
MPKKSSRWSEKNFEDLNNANLHINKSAKPNPTTSTNRLTKNALRVLDLNGFNVWRQNNGAVYDRKVGAFRKNSSTPGISDIIGFHKKTGQFIACEIKNGKDRLSNEQVIFLELVKKSGGISIVIRSNDDLEHFFKPNWQK